MAQIDDSRRLAIELQQVIQADRMAMDMINDAHDTKRSIEQKTADEKKRILQEADRKYQQALAEVAEEQREELQRRKDEATARYADARKAMEENMAHNRERWADEIVGRITGAAQG